jgi:hypothetical protein
MDVVGAAQIPPMDRNFGTPGARIIQVLAKAEPCNPLTADAVTHLPPMPCAAGKRGSDFSFEFSVLKKGRNFKSFEMALSYVSSC